MPKQHQAFPTLQLTQTQGSTGQEMIIQVKVCQHDYAIGSCHFYMMRHLLVLSTQIISSEALMMSRVAGGQREKKRPQTVCCFWEVAYKPKENQSSEICKHIFLVHHFSSSEMQMAACAAFFCKYTVVFKSKNTEQVAQRPGGCPMPGNTQCQAGPALSNLI